MWDTLEHREDGAALAAPQVGVLKRIVVINYQKEKFELINPEILSAEGEKIAREGCLSFSGRWGEVKRFDKIKVKYYDRKGVEHIVERDNLVSRCMQHEIDHLDGVLFIDRMVEDSLVDDDEKKCMTLEEAIQIAGKQEPQTEAA